MAVNLAGKVVDQAGDPKASLTVSLYEAATWEAAGAATATDTTDSDGLWDFTGKDITKTWLVVVTDGTKNFIIDARNSIQLTEIDLITSLSVDTIKEHTAAGGVTIDGIVIKDNVLRLAVDNSVLSLVGGSAGGEGEAGYGAILNLYGKTAATVPGQFWVSTPDAAKTANIKRVSISGAVAKAVVAWADCYHTGMKFGLAGTATGEFTIDGATSGTVTVGVANIAGTWTLVLPAAVGTAGYQLTDVNGDGRTAWNAAASLREYKDIVGLCDRPQAALDKILSTPVYHFHYKEGKGTGDKETEYVGVMGDEAPWAMHFNGGIVNPVNSLGFSILGMQALNAKIEVLKEEVAMLRMPLANRG